MIQLLFSNYLEAVTNSIESKFERIFSEDTLLRTKRANINIAKQLKDLIKPRKRTKTKIIKVQTERNRRKKNLPQYVQKILESWANTRKGLPLNLRGIKKSVFLGLHFSIFFEVVFNFNFYSNF